MLYDSLTTKYRSTVNVILRFETTTFCILSNSSNCDKSLIFEMFHIFIVLCILSHSLSKYAEDSDEIRDPNGDFQGLKDSTLKSDETFEDDQIDEGVDDEGFGDDEDLPEGFEVFDGVVMDTSNLMVQDVTDNGTSYKMYDMETEVGGQVLYNRPKREAGWHFVLFEDPLEVSGKGHLVLLQKLFGFTVESNSTGGNREMRLYEVFHVDLSNDITDDGYGNENDEDNERSEEGGPMPNQSSKEDPNDNAELVPSIVKTPADGTEDSGGGTGNAAPGNDVESASDKEESSTTASET